MVVSKYVCNAAGTGTEADESVETIRGSRAGVAGSTSGTVATTTVTPRTKALRLLLTCHQALPLLLKVKCGC